MRARTILQRLSSPVDDDIRSKASRPGRLEPLAVLTTHIGVWNLFLNSGPQFFQGLI
jgi:hypothetical protein